MSGADCRVCQSGRLRDLSVRDGVPVLQNFVYERRADALNAPTGQLEIRFCEACGFAANFAFDPSLLTYDQSYDNIVVSDRFSKYYAELSDQLYERFQLSGRTVFEIGCGKATFLRTLVSRHRDVAAIGLDPSYDGALKDPELPINLYDLGLIYDLTVGGEGGVRIHMTLTTPNCPVAESMPKMVKDAVAALDDVSNVEVELVWEPPWTSQMMSEDARLALEMMGIDWSDPQRDKGMTSLTVGKRPAKGKDQASGMSHDR